MIETWHLSESDIYYWLLKQSGDADLSFDLLQDTFLRALQQEKKFCDIHNQRAWLYRVAHNLLMDEKRKSGKLLVSSADENEIASVHEEQPAVDSLAQCLPKALEKLSPPDREVIRQCDLRGQTQQAFAADNGLTLVATKSRIQRARRKLKAVLQKQCHIRFDSQQRVCCFYADDENNH